MATVLRKGSKLGKYRLDRRLGQGSFADVWKARDLVEGVTVALKIAHPAAVAEWGRPAIEQEARIATRLRHPDIVAAATPTGWTATSRWRPTRQVESRRVPARAPARPCA